MKLLNVSDVSIVPVIVETPTKPDNNHCEVNKGKEKVQLSIINENYALWSWQEFMALICKLKPSHLRKFTVILTEFVFETK
jgi:hypothetical protein